MMDLITRLEREPDLFEYEAPHFIKVKGQIVFVRTRAKTRWRISIKADGFKYDGDTLGYHNLTWRENRRVCQAIPKEGTQAIHYPLSKNPKCSC